MKSLVSGAPAAVLAGLLLAGCNGGAPQNSEAPQISAAYKCYGVPDRAQCRLAYDKAGGPPIVFAGSSR